MADFLTSLQSFESGDSQHPERGGSNIANTHQGTSSGQAQGYNQITTGTWREFGGLAYAPTPLQATLEQQNAIAAKIPLGRWAPETLAFLRNSGFSLNPKATLADNIAANHGTLGVAPPPHTPTPGTPPPPGTTTINTTAPPGAPVAAGVTPSTQGGGVLGALTTPSSPGAQTPLQKAMGDVQKDLQGSGQQQPPQINPQQQLQSEQAAAPFGMQHQQLVANQAQQLSASLRQRAQAPLTWNAAPPGSTPGAGVGQQQQGAAQSFLPEWEQWQRMSQIEPGLSPPGLTLNTSGGLYG